MGKTVNIVGAGLAGLSCAITLAEAGFSSNLISQMPSERAQSIMAEGGINAALNTMGEDDSPSFHFQDTMKGGCYLNSEAAVKNLTENAPKVLEKLIKLGVPFNQKDGKLVLRNFGGQKKKRTAFAKSSTGKIIMTSLIDEVRKYEIQGLVKRYSRHAIVGMDIRNGSCYGVLIKDTFTEEKISLSGPVVMATGGLNGLFPEMTTGTTLNDGNAAAILFANGVSFSNLEFIQYHPTTIGISGKCMLVSEAARGEGGRLYAMKDGKPWYFMEEKYPELGNLMPRDVVSREEYAIMKDEHCDGKIYLDLRTIKEDVWENKLSDLRKEVMYYNHTDPKTAPIVVKPGIHFFMGGIKTDIHHKTNINHLYAAGECASIYHGANRLGGNSLLGAIFGGHVAGKTVMDEYEEIKMEENINSYSQNVPYYHMLKLRDILLSGLGIIRNQENIEKAILDANKMKDEMTDDLEKARINLGLAMLQSALERKESRGAHQREDYPSTSEEYKKTTVSELKDDTVNIHFEEINQG